MRHLRWLVPTVILALAAFLRLWALDRPGSLVFDELYYVRDAVSQLAHGFPTVWPGTDPAFGGELAREFTDVAAPIAHPPLGKWLIGLGVLLLGPDTGWGWRISVALAGVATVGVTMLLGRSLGRMLAGTVRVSARGGDSASQFGPDTWIAWAAGLLLAVDGVHVVLSRVALLDGFLTLFVAVGALLILQDWRATGRAAGRAAVAGRRGAAVHWRRPWLLAAGLTFGAAAAIKWSGLYPLAAFLALVTVGDLLRRVRARRRDNGLSAAPVSTGGRPGTDLAHALWQALVTAAIALPAAFAAYLASWIGWIVTPGGQGRIPGEAWWVSLWRWHVNAYAFHSTLTADHPYESNPFTWPLALRPTAMYYVASDSYVSAITPIPNPLVTWGGVVALLVLLWALCRTLVLAARRRTLTPFGGGAGAAAFVCAFVLTGYLSGWLPWVLTPSRSAVFQFYAVVLTPFAALALALVLAWLAGLARPTGFAGSASPQGAPMRGEDAVSRLLGVRLDASPSALQGRRISVALFAGATIVLGLLFWPIWIGMPVEQWFYQAHLWLPGWA